jgi:hypothetical protein
MSNVPQWLQHWRALLWFIEKHQWLPGKPSIMCKVVLPTWGGWLYAVVWTKLFTKKRIVVKFGIISGDMTRPAVYLNLQYSEARFNGVLPYMDNIVTYMDCDYRWVLDWWWDLLDSLIQCMTTLCSSLFNTHTSVHIHVFTAVAWWHFPTVSFPLPQGSQTVPNLSYQLLTATSVND